MTDFVASSGAKVKINPADFEDALELQAAIAERVSHSSLSIKGAADLAEQEIDIGEIVKLAMGVASDKKVREILFKCLARCTHDGQRITPKTFEPLEARQDFYEVSFACVKENIGHFIAPLTSKLSPALAGIMAKVQG